MAKEYKIYKHKFGIHKYSIDFMDNSVPIAYHRNEVSLALSEAILGSQGYKRQGEIEEYQPLMIVMDNEDEMKLVKINLILT